jgi:glycosyltransferase involved in cell wall biosynthesis
VPLRILHVSASFPRSTSDSVAPFLRDLVTVQREAGWDARVVALHDAGLPARHDVGAVPVRRVRYATDELEVLAYRGGGHARLQRPWHAALLPGMVLALTAGVAAEIRRMRPDVVHAHWLLPNAFAAAVVPGKHRFVITVHGNDVQLARGGAAGRVARLIAGRADAVVAVSEALAGEAEQVLGLAPGSVGVARLPLPPELVPSPLPEGPRRLLAAGRATREKGFDVLLDALARPEAAAWRATLVTDGPERDRLAAQAALLGSRVELRPMVPREELFSLMRAHHAVVVPSRSEGLGFVAAEALALGRPVVASAVGGLSSLVDAPADGRLVPPGDPAALAAALDDLATDGSSPRAAAIRPHEAAAVVAAHAAAYGLEVA